MSGWRPIMAKAEEAKSIMIRNLEEGEIEFESLLAKYPTDGMVYLKRGEAYEYHGEIQKAKSDYQQAYKLFPMPEWQNRASEGISRVQKKIEQICGVKIIDIKAPPSGQGANFFVTY